MDSDKLSALPQAFLHRMEDMLGDDFEPFLAAYEQPRTYGLRVNTAKISCEEFEQIVPFEVKKIPWVSNGYFYNEDVRPSRCALYQAGLYYLQEPSAMTPASRIPVEPGEYVLDMCAAPGGKATAVGSALKGEGLLVANDISTTRARALLRNLELFGIPNLFVANEKPEKMVKNFPEFFHKIILDAPCSGEGMFRKEEALARDWTPEKSEELSRIQKQLCLNAADMLQPGGQMLYSTCTFSKKEDEEKEEETEEKILEKSEMEAKAVANRIRKLFEDNYCVYDKKEGYRKATFKDIVILLRTTSDTAKVYEKELTQNGFPTFTDTGSNYFETEEIQIILSVLKIIDNPNNDIPLVTVLRSPIGGFTDNELIEIRLEERNGLFYQALETTKEKSQNLELKNKVNKFLNMLNDWQLKQEYLSLDELIWYIYESTNYYNFVSSKPNGELKTANLKLLFEKAKDYEKASFKGLYNFINYIDKINKGSDDMGSAKLIRRK